jgi:hypothetical protein
VVASYGGQPLLNSAGQTPEGGRWAGKRLDHSKIFEKLLVYRILSRKVN